MKKCILVCAVAFAATTMITQDAPKKPAKAGVQVVELINANGVSIGTAELSRTVEVFAPGQTMKWHGGKGIDIKLNLHDLPPGVHGMHIHRDPVCQGPDFTSAGGHINPFGKQHGEKNPEGPHAGDLPNITADVKGNVRETITGKYVSMEQLKAGRALVIHAQPDDLMTDPSGNSGERIACGVIQE